MSRYAKKDPVPISKIAYIDEPTLQQIVEEIEIPHATWGGIDGTLSDQADLNSALAGKVSTSHLSGHAPSDAQKNSDITKSEIEAKLTREVASHTHAGGGGLTQAQILTRQL